MHNADLAKSDFLEMLQVGMVDTGSGTLFGVPQKGAVEKRRLTLVIGIGNSGCAVIRQAFNVINQRLEKGYSEYVKFIAIGSPWSFRAFNLKEVDTLSLYSPLAGVRLSHENRSTFYKRFIPRDFPVSYLGYFRQSNKAMFYDINGETTNDQLLRDTISDYFSGDWAAHKDLPVDILVVSGLAGHKGSGTFIDIAVRAKQACPITENVTVYGYFMLPDTAEKFAADDTAKRSLYRNGFAALKELESYESILLENGRKEFFPAPCDKNNAVITEPVFDYPVLISSDYNKAIGMIAETIVMAVTDNGGSFFYNSFYAQKQVMRDIKLAKDKVSRFGILNPDACPEDSHMYCGIGYAQASIPEKIVIPHVVGTVSRRLYEPAADTSLGAAAQSAATAFCTQEKSLSRQEYQNAMRELLGLTPNQQLNEGSLWTKIYTYMSKYCRVRDNNVDITFDDIVQGNTRQYIIGFRTTAAITDGSNKMREAIRTEFKSLTEKAKVIMKKYGPRAMEYLYNGTGNKNDKGVNEDYSAFCLKTQVEFVANKFLDQRPGVAPRRPEPPKGLIGKLLALFIKTEYDAWIQGARTCEEMNVRYGVAQNMRDANGTWRTEYVNPLLDLLWNTSRFADVLETISNYYSGVGKSLDTDDYREFMKQSGEINGINLCRDAGTYAWVKGRISSKLANIKVQDVRDELVDDYYYNMSAWTSNEKGIARRQFDEVMSRVCAIGKYAGSNNGMDLTVADYFDHVLSTVEPARQKTEVANAVHDIFDQLMTKSSPCLKVRRGTELICNGTIMLPRSLQAGASGTLIQQAFQNELKASGVALSNLVYSAVVDSIVCYQTSVANALSDLDDLTLWENAYEANRDSATHLHNGEIPTLHMDTGYSQYNELTMEETAHEKHSTAARPILPHYANRPDARDWLNRIYGTGLTWNNYPSINIARYGNNFERRDDTKESAFRCGLFREKIEEAMRIGVIECEKTGNVYKYFINLIPREWTNLKARGYTEKNKDGLFVRGKALFEFLRNQNPQFNQPCRKQIFLRSPFFDAPGFDFTEAITVQHWDPERVEREHKAYLMRMMRKATGLFQDMEDTMWRLYPIEAELEEKEKRAVLRQAYNKFFNAYLFGLINVENETKWIGTVDEGGDTETIVRFSRRFQLDADDIVKKIYDDGLIFKLVYDEYKGFRDEYDLTDEKLDQIRKKVTGKLTDDQLDDMIEEREKDLKKLLSVYKDKYGSKSDPVGAIMDEYRLEPCRINEIESLVDFYKTLSEVLCEVL